MPDESSALKPAATNPAAAKTAANPAAKPDTPPLGLQLIAAEPPPDDISLADMLRFLFDYKYHIAVVALATTALAVLIALIWPPSYEATARLSRPSAAAVRVLADIRSGSTPQWVFGQFLDKLDSRALRRRYFDEQNLLAALVDADKRDGDKPVNAQEVFERKFNQRLTYERIDPPWQGSAPRRGKLPPPQQVEMHLKGREPAQLAAWLNGFIELANQETLAVIQDDLQTDLTYQIRANQEDITRLRRLSEQGRLDRIARLQEADSIKRDDILQRKAALEGRAQQDWQDEKIRLSEQYAIARDLDIVKPIFIEGRWPEDAPAVRTNLRKLPEYTVGSEALAAQIDALDAREGESEQGAAFVPGLRALQQELVLSEENVTINALQARESDDPHIDGLRAQEAALAQRQALSRRLAEDARLTAVRIDQAAYPPYQRLAPKRRLIVAIGAAVGLFLGVLLAFVLHVVKKARVEDEETLPSAAG